MSAPDVGPSTAPSSRALDSSLPDLGGGEGREMTQRDHDLVLVVDFGGTVRAVDRSSGTRGEGLLRDRAAHRLRGQTSWRDEPKAIILSGGPSSVYEHGAPQLDVGTWSTSGTQRFGICYGFMAMAQVLGGSVARTGMREYGRTAVSVTDSSTSACRIAADGECLDVSRRRSHRTPGRLSGDRHVGARSRCRVRGSPDRRLAGVQWHPEVLHTERGQQVLENFLFTIAGCTPDWTPANIIDESVLAIQHQVGGKHIICGLSGGVDSAVAAALVQRAVGSQLTCVFVDHGLLRQGEAEQVERDYRGGDRGGPEGGRCVRAIPRRARWRGRSGAEAQDHRPRVHSDLRGGCSRGGR